jgi:hypothetical protein
MATYFGCMEDRFFRCLDCLRLEKYMWYRLRGFGMDLPGPSSKMFVSHHIATSPESSVSASLPRTSISSLASHPVTLFARPPVPLFY